MNQLIQQLYSTGDLSLDYVWFPVLVWTVIALPLTAVLNRFKTDKPIYQYHGRMALLLALPVGLIGSYAAEMIGAFINASSAGNAAKFIVFYNPISVVATQTEASVQHLLATPAFWIGFVDLLLVIGMAYCLLRLAVSGLRLRQLDRQLSFTTLNKLTADKSLFRVSSNQTSNPLIAFSEDTTVPFTYGWLRIKIVIPAELRDQPEKIAMAIRHELAHIKHKDFLFNGMLLAIKALFWFHPLVHALYKKSQEYREITCDGQVLADNRFSKKRYAALLLELAEREHKNSRLAMSMAVNPSSLKKRIQIMSDQNISTTALRSSFILTFFAASLIVLAISCSDITDEDGITNSEFQQTQTQMAKQSDNHIPLYIINGEQMKSTSSNNQKIARIKSEYIKSVSVWKGQKAIERYGQAGRNGAIEIEFIDGVSKETVYSDLKDHPDASSAVPPPPPEPKENYFVAVEKMPELKGGLQSLMMQINYPEEAAKAGIEGRVLISFIVDKQGNVKDPQIVRGVDESLDQEALRVVKQAKFKPGKQSGKPVRVQYAIPITFKLSGSSDDTKDSSKASTAQNIKDQKSLDRITVTYYAEVKPPTIKKSEMLLYDLEIPAESSLPEVLGD